MNIKANYKYQLKSGLSAHLIFYIVMVCIMVMMLLSALFANNYLIASMVGGLEVATLIYVFVFAVASYKDEMNFSVLNAKSRTNFYFARLASLVTVAAALSIIDNVLGLITKGFASLMSNVAYINYVTMTCPVENLSEFAKIMLNLALCFSAYLTAMGIGTILTAINYRLNKVGKTIFWILFGAFLLIGLPNLVLFFPKLVSFLSRVNLYLSSTYMIIPFNIVVFCILYALSYLLLRKQEAKKAS